MWVLKYDDHLCGLRKSSVLDVYIYIYIRRTDAILNAAWFSVWESLSMWKRKTKVWISNSSCRSFFGWWSTGVSSSSPVVEWGGTAVDVDGLLSGWDFEMVQAMSDANGTILDGLGWILLANEDLQKPQFGFNALVLFVFVHHRHAVFLLNIPVGEIKTFCLRTMLIWWR